MNEKTSLFGLVRKTFSEILFGPILDRGRWIADLHRLTRLLVDEAMTPTGGLTLRVDADRVRSLCERMLRDESPEELLVPAARLAGAAGWSTLAPLIASAVVHADPDADLVIDGSRALEQLGAVPDSVLAALRARDLEADGRTIATEVLIRCGTHADREQALDAVRTEIDGGDPEATTPLILRSLHEAGLDVRTELQRLLRLHSILSWEPAAEDIARLVADLAEPVPFSTLQANNNQDWVMPILLQMLHAPHQFVHCREPLRQYVSTYSSAADDEALVGLTLLGRMGEDHAFLEPYLTADNWMVRIGAYLALSDSLGPNEFASLSPNESDSDAHAVLELVCFRAGSREVPGVQRRAVSCAFNFDTILKTLVHDLATDYEPGTPLATIRAVDLGKSVSGSDISIVVPWYQESALEWIDDVASWSSSGSGARLFLALCKAGDEAAVATLESLAVRATDETELGAILTCLSTIGGPRSTAGRALERLVCLEPGDRWIGEDEYPSVERIVWTGNGSLRRSCLRALKPEVVRRRPLLLESFWSSPDPHDTGASRKAVMQGVRDGIIGTPVLDALWTLHRGESVRTVDLSPLASALHTTATDDLDAIAEIGETLIHDDVPAYLRGEYAWESAIGGARIEVDALASASGLSRAEVIDFIAASKDRRSRECAAKAAASDPDPVYRSTMIRLISTDDDEDVREAAREAWDAINASSSQTDPGLIVVTPGDAEGDETVPASLIDTLRDAMCPPDELVHQIGRHVILEPVSSVPEQAGTLSQEEFESLALHMQVQFHDEQSNAVVVEIVEDETVEALNLLLDGKSGRVLSGRWT